MLLPTVRLRTPWNLPAMAAAQPPRDEAAPAAPRTLRLLERAERLPSPHPSPVQRPAPVDWTARLGRWVDRLLAA